MGRILENYEQPEPTEEQYQNRDDGGKDWKSDSEDVSFKFVTIRREIH